MTAFVDSFRRFLEFEKRYSPHTTLAYTTDIAAFLSFLQSTYEIANPDEVRHTHVRSWIVDLIDAGLDPRSVNRKLSTLRTYFRFLLKMGHVSQNPLKKVIPPKARKQLPSVVDEKSLSRLRESFGENKVFSQIRDQAVIELLYGLGLRRAELISLKVTDVDFSRMQVKVFGKRQKERIVPFGKDLAEFVQHYMKLRSLVDGLQTDCLIITDKGKAAYPRMVHDIVYRALSLVSTVTQRSPHTLRHSYATHMLEAGANIEAIKELLGHASLAATQIYTQTSVERLKKTYKQAHPKA
jgi:integrase/recombinase XerC